MTSYIIFISKNKNYSIRFCLLWYNFVGSSNNLLLCSISFLPFNTHTIFFTYISNHIIFASTVWLKLRFFFSLLYCSFVLLAQLFLSFSRPLTFYSHLIEQLSFSTVLRRNSCQIDSLFLFCLIPLSVSFFINAFVIFLFHE